MLVFANKQDLRGAKTAAEITEELDMDPTCEWLVQNSIISENVGVKEGLAWLSDKLTF